jgi:hypothetical protein
MLARCLLHRGLSLEDAHHQRRATPRCPALKIIRYFCCHLHLPAGTLPGLKGGFDYEGSKIRSPKLNARGQVAVEGAYENGTEGIFLATPQ